MSRASDAHILQACSANTDERRRSATTSSLCHLHLVLGVSCTRGSIARAQVPAAGLQPAAGAAAVPLWEFAEYIASTRACRGCILHNTVSLFPSKSRAQKGRSCSVSHRPNCRAKHTFGSLPEYTLNDCQVAQMVAAYFENRPRTSSPKTSVARTKCKVPPRAAVGPECLTRRRQRALKLNFDVCMHALSRRITRYGASARPNLNCGGGHRGLVALPLHPASSCCCLHREIVKYAISR